MVHSLWVLLPLIVSAIYVVLALNIPFGSLKRPGPGAYPVIIGCIATCLSIFVAISDLKAKSKAQVYKDENLRYEQHNDSGSAEKSYIFRIIGCILVMLSIMFLFDFLGALLSLFILTFLLLKLFGTPGWIKSFVISACFSSAIFFLFNNMLKSLLPQGLLFFFSF